MFREPTLWELYKWRIVAVIALCVLQAALIGWLLITRNKRRRAEEETSRFAQRVKAERERLEEVVRNVPGVVWESRIEPGSNTRKAVFVSPYAESMLGYSVEEWLSTPDFAVSIIHKEDRDEFIRGIEMVLERGKEEALRFRWRTKEGRLIWVETHVAVMRDQEGKAIGLRGVTMDISERKRDEQALQQLSGRLLMLQDEEQRRIAAELHDGLGQSLAIIKNRALMGLRDHADQNQIKEQFKEIASTATSSILEVRGIAHNLRPYELDRLGLVAAIESMIEGVSATTSIKISGDLEPIDGLLSAEAETSVYRIIQESLNNVVKHSNASIARIEIKKSLRQMTISVQDNGHGISRSADNGHKIGGFGLAGIGERVRALGGSFAIDSQPSRGTTLTVRLELQSVAAE